MISKPQQAMMIVAATAFMRLSRGQLPICHELPIIADGAARAAAPDGAHRGCPGGPDARLQTFFLPFKSGSTMGTMGCPL